MAPRSRAARSRLPRRRWLVAAALGLLAAAPSARAITGVCPDGSVFIVQSESAIPCPEAKRMDPHEVPPMRPEYLPRPYTWEVYEEQGDPNNPYNLIDAAREVRALREAASPDGQAAPIGAEPDPAPQAGSNPTPPRYRAQSLGLSDAQLHDLYQIVELSQPRAPATFVKQTADGRDIVRIAFAHSLSFEARLDRAEGPVLLFLAVAHEPATLLDQFTFVQGHLAFQPQAADDAQMGILQGRLGDLDAGEVALGYVALPAEMDVERPMDVYWNDRRLTVTFRP